jgi:hypothetical protein
MLAELEARLRLKLYAGAAKPRWPDFYASNSTSAVSMSVVAISSSHLQLPVLQYDDPLIYWGYLVTNRLHQFMAGELYY